MHLEAMFDILSNTIVSLNLLKFSNKSSKCLKTGTKDQKAPFAKIILFAPEAYSTKGSLP